MFQICVSLIQQTQTADGLELVRNLHERIKGEGGVRVPAVLYHRVIVHELEVVKLPLRQLVVCTGAPRKRINNAGVISMFGFGADVDAAG